MKRNHTTAVFLTIITAAITGALCSAESTPVSIINADFEHDGGPFGIPTGWVPFGDAKLEGAHYGDWKLQLADLNAKHHAGVYQVIPNITTGAKYRLTVDVKAAHNQLPIRVGLLGDISLEKITYSNKTTATQWTTLTVEAIARTPQLLIVLEMENVNATYQLLEAGAFDNVTLTRISQPTTTSQPLQKPDFQATGDVGKDLANLWSLAWPRTNLRTFLASSRHPDPDNNGDFDHIEGKVKIAGETWSVLKTLDGPGCITRIWMTNFARQGIVRIETDERTVYEARLMDFFSRDNPWPLAGKNSGAWMSYVPIPFSKSARVMVKDAEQSRFYWQITHQRSPGCMPAVDRSHIEAIRYQWAHASIDPKPAVVGQQQKTTPIRLPQQGEQTIHRITGAGMLGTIRIELPDDQSDALRDLQLIIRCDKAKEPQVDIPLDLLFNVPTARTICRGLLTGNAPGIGGYCYYPMPYRNGCEITLQNKSSQSIDLTAHLRWVPITDTSTLSPLRFYAIETCDAEAGKGELFTPLDIKGRGHFVGLTAAMKAASKQDTHYLEGDEYIWVDGERKPSTAGTGTEDYFTCGWYFSSGPVTLAPFGATYIDRDKYTVWAYRQHIPDWIPFDQSFRFSIEVGDATHSPLYANYRTLTAYYLQP